MHEIGQLTLWEVDDLMSYWKDYPPVHILMAAYLMGNKAHRSRGHQSKTLKADAKAPTGFSFADLAREVAYAGGAVLNKVPDMYR